MPQHIPPVHRSPISYRDLTFLIYTVSVASLLVLSYIFYSPEVELSHRWISLHEAYLQNQSTIESTQHTHSNMSGGWEPWYTWIQTCRQFLFSFWVNKSFLWRLIGLYTMAAPRPGSSQRLLQQSLRWITESQRGLADNMHLFEENPGRPPGL